MRAKAVPRNLTQFPYEIYQKYSPMQPTDDEPVRLRRHLGSSGDISDATQPAAPDHYTNAGYKQPATRQHPIGRGKHTHFRS